MSLNRFFRSQKRQSITRRRLPGGEISQVELLEQRIVLSADPLTDADGMDPDMEEPIDDGTGSEVDGTIDDSLAPIEDGTESPIDDVSNPIVDDGTGGDEETPENPNPDDGSGGDGALPPEGMPGIDFSLLTPGVDYIADSIIIQVKPGYESQVASYRELIGVSEVQNINNKYEVWTFDTGAITDYYDEMWYSGHYSILEADYLQQYADIETTATPDDTDYGNLWGMPKVEADKAWDTATGSYTTVVGIIDSGIDYLHEDLRNNIWLNQGEIPPTILAQLQDTDGDGVITFIDLNDASNTGNAATFLIDQNANSVIDAGDLLNTPQWENGTDEDGNGYTDDFIGWDFAENDNDPMDDVFSARGHGTHVAGTVGAQGNNNLGVTGVNWQVSLAGLKIGADNGSLPSSAILAAIEYASEQRSAGMIATNNSYGGGPSNSAISQAIADAGANDQLFIAAAGNGNRDNDARAFFPASYTHDNIIAVASSTTTDGRSSFSQWGLVSVDIAAPGSGIYSTVPSFVDADGYDFKSGTSMASPMVAGAVALVYSNDTSLSAAEIRDNLFASADQVGPWPSLVSTGGRLNVFQALDPPKVTASLSDTSVVTSTTVVEGDTGTTAVDVWVELSGSEITSNFTFDLVAVAGTASSGSDFVSQTTPVTFTVGGATKQKVTFFVQGDTTFETDETFRIEFANVPTYVSTNVSGLNVTIDDDESVLGLAQSETTVVGTRLEDFTYTHVQDGMNEVLLEKRINDGQSAGVDHRWDFNVAPGDNIAVVVVGGHTSVSDTFFLQYMTATSGGWQTFATLPYGTTPMPLNQYSLPNTVVGDTQIRLVDQDWLDLLAGNAVTPDQRLDGVGIDHLYFVSTRGDGSAAPAKVELTVDDSSASEAGPDTASFTLSLLDGPRATDTPVLLHLSGSATPDDYALSVGGTNLASGTSTVATIPAGSTSISVLLTPNADFDLEDTEQLTVALDAAYHVPGHNTTGTFDIHDNDKIPNVAQGELTSQSLKQGTYRDTWVLGDGKEELLTERRIDVEHTSLLHMFQFQVPNSGSSIFQFDLTAFRDDDQVNPGDSDSFIFDISVDGGEHWSSLTTVSDANEGSQSTAIDMAALPGAETAGTNFNVLVRITDSDSSAGDIRQSTLRIDHMQFSRDASLTGFSSVSSTGSSSASTTTSSDSTASDEYWSQLPTSDDESLAVDSGSTDSDSGDESNSDYGDGGSSVATGDSDSLEDPFGDTELFDELYAGI